MQLLLQARGELNKLAKKLMRGTVRDTIQLTSYNYQTGMMREIHLLSGEMVQQKYVSVDNLMKILSAGARCYYAVIWERMHLKNHPNVEEEIQPEARAI